jgi:hypothetical protein
VTPKLWSKIAKKIAAKEKLLVQVGVASLVVFIILIIAIVKYEIFLNPLVLLPIIILFYCCGFGLVRHLFKTVVEKNHKSTNEYFEISSTVQKYIMWFCSLGISIWFLGLTIILLAVTSLGLLQLFK